jgi:hypothetical protein
MGVSAFGQGTQSATVGTEHFVSSPNVAGLYSFHVDTVNMVDGDILQLRVYQMILTGGTSRVVWVQEYHGAQDADDLIKVSPPLGNELTDTNSLRYSIKQTFGTSRNFDWKVLTYA